MGSHFSMGSMARQLEPLTDLKLDQLQAKWAVWQRVSAAEYDNPGFLITYEQFVDVFQLPKSVAHEVFMFFEAGHEDAVAAGVGFERAASVAELFGGLVLLCKASQNEKIEFVFRVFDRNGDGSLTIDEIKAVFSQGDGLSEADLDKTVQMFMA